VKSIFFTDDGIVCGNRPPWVEDDESLAGHLLHKEDRLALVGINTGREK